MIARSPQRYFLSKSLLLSSSACTLQPVAVNTSAASIRSPSSLSADLLNAISTTLSVPCITGDPKNIEYTIFNIFTAYNLLCRFLRSSLKSLPLELVYIHIDQSCNSLVPYGSLNITSFARIDASRMPSKPAQGRCSCGPCV